MSCVASALPDAPNLDVASQAGQASPRRAAQDEPGRAAADAQFDLAKQYGFSSWRALKAHIDSLTVDGQLFDAARNGDVDALAALLDKHPDKLHARSEAVRVDAAARRGAQQGHLATVDLLLQRGLDVNTRERGDNTYAMHWAAAAGHARRRAAAGRRRRRRRRAR